jgi:hypothetical protein
MAAITIIGQHLRSRDNPEAINLSVPGDGHSMTSIDSNDDIQRAVRQAQQRFWMALKDKDKQAFEYLLAEDFVLRSPGQTNQG